MLICQRVAKCPRQGIEPTTERERNPQILYQKNRAPKTQPSFVGTAVSSEAWAKLRDWASVAARGRLLLSGTIAHASLKAAVLNPCNLP